jgi:hypothetical protein
MTFQKQSKKILFILLLGALPLALKAEVDTMTCRYCRDTIAPKIHYSDADFRQFSGDKSLVYGHSPLRFDYFLEGKLTRFLRFLLRLLDYKATPVIFYIVVFSACIFILFRFLRGQAETVVQASHDISLLIDEKGEQIQETDLDALLKQEIAEGRYNHAVRILFLQSIRQLANQNWITLQERKTNRSLSTEIKNTEVRNAFLEITHIYEYAWFGNLSLDSHDFSLIEDRFRQFNNQVHA